MIRLLFPPHWKQWLGPLIVVGIAGAALAFAVVVFGWVDLSAAKPHPDGWARFLHYTFSRSTAHHAAGVTPPADLDSPIRVAAGAVYYGQVCARCHSGPGFGQNPIVLSMHPRPQYLATDLPTAGFGPPELFRIVKAGVKYSAMPSWPADGRDDEVWNVVAFLRRLPKLTPEQFRALAVVEAPQSVDPARRFGPPPLDRAYALRNDREPPVESFAYKTPTYGFSDYALISDPLATCARCHGADGRGGGAFPNLTLQNADYLRRSLTAFASGRRQSGFMRMVAAPLSPAQIDALAAYYAARPRVASEPGSVSSAEGQQLVLQGDKAHSVAACASCHGITRPAGEVYPRLEGQSRWYIANQMHVFQAGGRGGTAGRNPMPAIARKLDGRQIDAIAAYYAAQPPLVVQDGLGRAG